MATFSAGQYVNLASLLEQLVPSFVQKGSDETVTSNTTLQDDDELFLSLPVATWEITGVIWIFSASTTAGDFKCAFTFPTGTLSYSATGYHVNYAAVDGSRDIESFGVVGSSSSPSGTVSLGCVAGVSLPVQIRGTLVNSVAGTLGFQWAENSSNSTSTLVKAGSWLKAQRLVIT